MRLIVLLLAAPLLLAACATPREACINAATRDLRVLDRLIAETEANIARGYAIDRVQIIEPRWVLCPGPRRIVTRPDGSQVLIDDGFRHCWRDVTVTTERPRAIEIAAERRILASTRNERARIARETERAIAECRARFPEA
jgi:hypothetical protein